MAYFDEVMADSPAGYWRCDESAGATVVVDSSGNGRSGNYPADPSKFLAGEPGLLVGDSSTSVKWGYGGQEHATIPYGSWLDAASWTWECLFKLESLPAEQHFINRYYSGNAQFRYGVTVDGALMAETFSSGFKRLTTAAGSVQIGVPYHAAWTWSAGASALRLTNLNTGAVVTASGTTAKNPVGTPDLWLGSDGNLRLYGWLDEVAFYPSVLSSARLQAHADVASGAAAAPPQGNLAGVAPAVAGSFSASVTIPPVDGSLAGLAPAVTASFAGGSPDAVVGSLAGQAPAVYGSFTGFASSPPAVPVVSSSEYANLSGYGYGGVGLVDYDPPIAATPARVRREVTRRVHQSLPAPDLVDGRPV